MKKCIGCGVTLQVDDSSKKGYVKSIEQDYCQRCFRLTHYNDLTIDMKNAISRKDVINCISNIEGLFVFVIDILNIEASLQDDILNCLSQKDVILIVNKYDILPKNANVDKILTYIDRLLSTKMKGINVKDVLLTQKFDPSFNELFFESLSYSKHKDIIFIGNVNAGKSTIVNKLVGNNNLTVSRYPSTTLDITKTKLNGYTFIDTPGLIDDTNLIMYCKDTELKRLLITSTIKPLIYQLYEKQSYFIDGIVRLDVANRNKHASIIFYMNPLLKVHRTKTINADKYENTHVDDFNLKWNIKESHRYILDSDSCDLIINGLGIISFKNIKEVVVTTEKGIKIDRRESVF